jgi:magnesium transporter
MAKRMRMKRYSAPGTAPGTLHAHAEAEGMAVAMTLVRYDEERFEERPLALEEVETLPVPSEGVLWLDVQGLSDPSVVKAVGERFGFHRLALEDVVNVPQRPKADDYGDYLLVVLREILYPDQVEQVSFFLGRNLLVSFRERGNGSFEAVRGRLRTSAGMLRQRGADTLLYSLCDGVIDSFFPILEKLGDDLDDLEERALVDPSPATFRRVRAVKRALLGVRHAVWPARDVMGELGRTEGPLVSDSMTPFFHDCYDHTVQLMDMVETLREMAAGIQDEYMMAISNRMNEIMKVLTVVATLFIPLSFVTGLYGMNFDRSSPWNLPELGWRYGYPMVLSAMAVIVAGMLWFFRKHRFI